MGVHARASESGMERQGHDQAGRSEGKGRNWLLIGGQNTVIAAVRGKPQLTQRATPARNEQHPV